MKFINLTLLFLAILSVVFMVFPEAEFKFIMTYGLLAIGPLVILFTCDFFLPAFKIKYILITWRLISSLFAIATILSVYIANGENCNYACGYPIIYLTMANWILVGVTLLLFSIQIVKKRK